MGINSKPLACSADVRVDLNVNGYVVSIGQLGPDFLILDNPPDHPPSDAEVAVWIDGRERRWRVWLPEGINPQSTRTPVA